MYWESSGPRTLLVSSWISEIVTFVQNEIFLNFKVKKEEDWVPFEVQPGNGPPPRVPTRVREHFSSVWLWSRTSVNHRSIVWLKPPPSQDLGIAFH